MPELLAAGEIDDPVPVGRRLVLTLEEWFSDIMNFVRVQCMKSNKTAETNQM
jgi:hypothetical protein